MLRPMHEMNGDWYPWSGTTNGNSPAAFVRAWRHIHDIFAAEGATNVTWVWSINRESVPARPGNAFSAYYPGDGYVDWTAISGFNGADTTSSPLWKPYTALYEQPLAYLQGLGKPICIAEIGTLGSGSEKAAWLTDAFSNIAGDSRVDAVVYYEALEVGAKTQDWRATVTPPSLEAYRRAVEPVHFLGGTPAPLRSWVGSLDTEQWRYLTSFEPKY